MLFHFLFKYYPHNNHKASQSTVVFSHEDQDHDHDQHDQYDPHDHGYDQHDDHPHQVHSGGFQQTGICGHSDRGTWSDENYLCNCQKKGKKIKS